MRQIVDYHAKDGTVTHRVRYRNGGAQHSETFRHRKDAETFAQLLDISPLEGLRWLFRDSLAELEYVDKAEAGEQ